jgi:hypothetical protein
MFYIHYIDNIFKIIKKIISFSHQLWTQTTNNILKNNLKNKLEKLFKMFFKNSENYNFIYFFSGLFVNEKSNNDSISNGLLAIGFCAAAAGAFCYYTRSKNKNFSKNEICNDNIPEINNIQPNNTPEPNISSTIKDIFYSGNDGQKITDRIFRFSQPLKNIQDTKPKSRKIDLFENLPILKKKDNLLDNAETRELLEIFSKEYAEKIANYTDKIYNKDPDFPTKMTNTLSRWQAYLQENCKWDYSFTQSSAESFFKSYKTSESLYAMHLRSVNTKFFANFVEKQQTREWWLSSLRLEDYKILSRFINKRELLLSDYNINDSIVYPLREFFCNFHSMCDWHNFDNPYYYLSAYSIVLAAAGFNLSAILMGEYYISRTAHFSNNLCKINGSFDLKYFPLRIREIGETIMYSSGYRVSRNPPDHFITHSEKMGFWIKTYAETLKKTDMISCKKEEIDIFYEKIAGLRYSKLGYRNIMVDDPELISHLEDFVSLFS